MQNLKHILLASGLLTAATAVSGALYRADIDEINDSGVNGVGEARIDGDNLWIGLYISDLEIDAVHPQHIHGRFDSAGNPIDSFAPTMAHDADGDGFIEVLEGVPAYGDVILPLSSPPPSGNDPSTITFEKPLAGGGGTYIFEQMYDLSASGTFFSPVTGTNYDGSDLLPLDLRTVVIHGMTLGSEGFGPGEADGTPGYKASLPVAVGNWEYVIPEPSTFLGFTTVGVIGLLVTMRRRRPIV